MRSARCHDAAGLDAQPACTSSMGRRNRTRIGSRDPRRRHRYPLLGGYVVLPLASNGRAWLAAHRRGRRYGPTGRQRRRGSMRGQKAAAGPGPASSAGQPADSPSAQKAARAQLERACARVVVAPCGSQDSIRHRECYIVGGLIARGDISYAEAYAALLEAALAMPIYADPWKNFEERVARSIEAGMAAPLPLAGDRAMGARFRARMRPGARGRTMADDLHGAGAAAAAAAAAPGAAARDGCDGRDDKTARWRGDLKPATRWSRRRRRIRARRSRPTSFATWRRSSGQTTSGSKPCGCG